MNMEVNNELIDKLAILARLEFDSVSREAIKKDLQNILGFVDKINELQLDDVDPLIYITDEVNVLRGDDVKQTITHEEAMKNVPVKDSDYIKVPKVLKGK